MIGFNNGIIHFSMEIVKSPKGIKCKSCDAIVGKGKVRGILYEEADSGEGNWKKRRTVCVPCLTYQIRHSHKVTLDDALYTVSRAETLAKKLRKKRSRCE